jgi:hypothetical protein
MAANNSSGEHSQEDAARLLRAKVSAWSTRVVVVV